MEITEKDFRECEICEAKAGTPTLCPSCVHNKAVIYRLQKELKRQIKLKRVVLDICNELE